jgi:threonine/homoserine/homoserine lactone efflux protein
VKLARLALDRAVSAQGTHGFDAGLQLDVDRDGLRARPQHIVELLVEDLGAAFQWLNPKGWVMAVGAVTTYAAVAAFPLNVLLMACLFGSLGVLSSATWLGFGTGLKRLLTSPRAVRAVNATMALLLAASLWPILADAWR